MLSLKWMRRKAKVLIDEFKQKGLEFNVPYTKHELRASTSWCLKWLARNGFGSRAVSTRRPSSALASEAALIKFCHCLREVVLAHTEPPPPLPSLFMQPVWIFPLHLLRQTVAQIEIKIYPPQHVWLVLFLGFQARGLFFPCQPWANPGLS